jgi:hypothetical protein
MLYKPLLAVMKEHHGFSLQNGIGSPAFRHFNNFLSSPALF